MFQRFFHLCNVPVHTGKRDGADTFDKGIVVADDCHILRHPEPSFPQMIDHDDRCLIDFGKDSIKRELPGKILIDYVTKTQNRTDTKKLKNDYPDIYSELVQTTIGRKLKITRESV